MATIKLAKAFAPATVANFVCGYDILGFAVDSIGDEVDVSFNNTSEHSFELRCDNAELHQVPANKNVAYSMAVLLSEKVGNKNGLHICLHKKMPLNSGMGSSSASSVAALIACNAILGNPLTKQELLPLAIEGERLACGNAHADNVAPCLFGGIQLVKSYDPLQTVSLPYNQNWRIVLIHPHVEVPTKHARQILKDYIKLKDAVIQFGNIAGLVAGIYSNDENLVSSSMCDVLIEPHRALLIPHFYSMKEIALRHGAMGFGISGSGPSVFALCTSENVSSIVKENLDKMLSQQKIAYDSYIVSIDAIGARIIQQMEEE